MVLWLEADTGIQTQSIAGTATAVWVDQSTSSNNATQASTYNGAIQAPSPTSNTLNGHAVMHFTQSNHDYLKVTLNGLGTLGDMFAVFREPSANTSPPNLPGAWTFGPNGTMFNDSTGAIDDFLIEWQVQKTAPVSFTSFNLYNASSSGSSWTNRLNGKLLSTSTSITPNSMSSGLIGNAPGGWTDQNGDMFAGSTYFDGDIAELVIYDRVLSDQERIQMGQYLEAKYNLPNISIPAPPTSLQAKALNSSSIYLSWTPPTATDGVFYTILRQNGTGAFTQIGLPTVSPWLVDPNAVQGTAYNYEVVANSYGGSSAPSGTASASTAANPTNIPTLGLTLWLRGDLGVGLTSSSISAWGDQSGLGNNALALSSQPAPTLGTAGGFPAAHFISSSQQIVTLPNVLPGATTGEMFVIIRTTSSGLPGAYTFGSTGTDVFGSNTSGYLNASNAVEDGFLSATQVVASIPSGSNLTNFNIYSAAASPLQWNNWLNGSFMDAVQGGEQSSPVNIPGPLTSTGYIGTDDMERPISGTYNYGVTYFDGDIAELIVYNRNLAVSERLTVGGYLTAKYTIAGVIVPAAPTSLSAIVDQAANVEISWPITAGAAAYNIQRSVNGGSWVTLATVGANSASNLFIDGTAIAGTTLQYQVQALSYSGQSAYSAAAACPAPGAIDASTGLPYWLESAIGDNPLPGAPSTPPAPPSGPQGSSPPALTLVAPGNASLQ